MTIILKYKDNTFGVGDKVRVMQTFIENNKSRSQIFDGIIIYIKGDTGDKTLCVRKIGEQSVGIEKIFPLNSPNIKDIKLIRKGVEGVRKSKLLFTRNKSKKEIEKIYSRSKRKNTAK